MFHPDSFRTFARVAQILLLLLLIGVENVPNLSESEAHSLSEAGLQRARSHVLITAAYTLHYRPASEHAHAMHDRQTA